MQRLQIGALKNDSEVMVDFWGLHCQFRIPENQALVLFKNEDGIVTVELTTLENQEVIVESETLPSVTPITDDAPTIPPVKSEEEAIADFQALEDELFHQLAELRRSLAKEQNVPPYIIFQDKTLREMAQVLPNDVRTLSTISGVGKAKLEKYGDMVLAVIHNFMTERTGVA